MKWHAAVFFGVVATFCSTSYAHPGVHTRIDEVSAKIRKAPSARLYLQRAELRVSHGDFDGARRDVVRAGRLAPDDGAVDLVRGLVEVEAGDAAAAITALSKFLESDPDHVAALVLRANARSSLGKHAEAAADLAAAIDAAQTPRPDWYLSRSDALVACGRSEGALDSLRAGIERLGPLASMIEKAVQISDASGKWMTALQFVAQLPERLRSSPKWLIRTAELQTAAGQVDEARASYQRALDVIRELPNPRREAPAVVAFRQQAKAALASDIP